MYYLYHPESDCVWIEKDRKEAEHWVSRGYAEKITKPQYLNFLKEDSMKVGEKIWTPEFRVSFADVFERNTLSEKYQLDMLFPEGTDLSKLKKAVLGIAIEHWGSKDRFPKNLRSPFRDQQEKHEKGYAGYEPGCMFITPKSANRPPGIVGPDGKTHITKESGEFYGGCWARATIKAATYIPTKNGKPAGRPGITFFLQNIQKVRDDDPFGDNVASNADEDFEPVEGGADDPGAYKDSETSDMFGGGTESKESAQTSFLDD